MGALIDQKHMQRVLGYIEGGVADGARVAFGGQQALKDSGGFYVEATVLDGVRPQMKVAREEIFGPVLTVMTFTRGGRGDPHGQRHPLRPRRGGVDRRHNVAHRLTHALRGGTVWVNSFDRSTMATPFGGFKHLRLRTRSLAARDRQVLRPEDHLDRLPMSLRAHVAALLAARQPGRALPGAFFTDEALYQAELDSIFARHWLFLASEPELAEGGDYRTYQIGPYPIFLLRRDDGSHRRLPQYLPAPRLTHPAAGRRHCRGDAACARTIAGAMTSGARAQLRRDRGVPRRRSRRSSRCT